MPLAASYPPRLLPAPAAARYLGVSETKLRELGLARRILHGKRLYHIADLDAFADSLPIEGEEEGSTCRNVFGVAS